MQHNIKKDALKRLKIINGHLKKIIDMVEEDNYCIDILHQSLAVQNALKKVDSLILNQHLHQCVTHAFHQGNRKKEYTITELLKLYEISNK